MWHSGPDDLVGLRWPRRNTDEPSRPGQRVGQQAEKRHPGKAAAGVGQMQAATSISGAGGINIPPINASRRGTGMARLRWLRRIAVPVFLPLFRQAGRDQCLVKCFPRCLNVRAVSSIAQFHARIYVL